MNKLVKVAIKLPRDESKFIYSFALLYFLRDVYKKCEINVFGKPHDAEVFDYLPFKVRYYSADLDELSYLGIHKYGVSLTEVFNLHLFIDLESDLKSSFFAMTFKAKERIGYREGANKYLLTHVYEKISDLRFDEDQVMLLKKHIKTDWAQKEIVGEGRALEDFEEEKLDELSQEYLFICLDSRMENYELAKKLIFEFELPLIIYDTNPNKNTIKAKSIQYMQTCSVPLLKSLITHSRGVLSWIPFYSQISCYLGVESLYLGSEISNFEVSQYFKTHPGIVICKENEPLEINDLELSKPLNNAEELVDSVLFKFNL